MDKHNFKGTGLIGVHPFPESTGLFTVIPSDVLETLNKDSGFYPIVVTHDFDGNIQIKIMVGKYVSYEEMERLLPGSPLKGMGIGGLMTSGIWGFVRSIIGKFSA